MSQGKSGGEIASALRAARRKNTPDAARTCKNDPVAPPNFDAALEQLRKTKILVVGTAMGGDSAGKALAKASAEVVGVQFIPISFDEMAAAYAAADSRAAKAFAERWISTAEKVVEPGRDEIERSGLMYVAMKNLMAQYGAGGISVNCLGGFYGGHLKAYPCLGFSQLNNDGLIGGCEADQMSALTMAVMGAGGSARAIFPIR